MTNSLFSSPPVDMPESLSLSTTKKRDWMLEGTLYAWLQHFEFGRDICGHWDSS
jgi:hypothetical protein